MVCGLEVFCIGFSKLHWLCHLFLPRYISLGNKVLTVCVYTIAVYLMNASLNLYDLLFSTALTLSGSTFHVTFPAFHLADSICINQHNFMQRSIAKPFQSPATSSRPCTSSFRSSQIIRTQPITDNHHPPTRNIYRDLSTVPTQASNQTTTPSPD